MGFRVHCSHCSGRIKPPFWEQFGRAFCNEKCAESFNKKDCVCCYCKDNFMRSWEELQIHIKECKLHPLFLTNKKLNKALALLRELDAELDNYLYSKSLNRNEIYHRRIKEILSEEK